jgi:Zn-dependent protease with chaperone function
VRRRISTCSDPELTGPLEALCAELSQELDIEAPECSVLDSDRVMAGARPAALGRAAVLKVSRGAIEQLDPMALRWIVAHELGHLADKAGRRRSVVKGSFTLVLALVAAEALAITVSVALGPPLILAGTLLATAAVRRPQERAADRLAHRCCAADPDAGRRALIAARRSSPLRWRLLFDLTQAIGGYPPFDERIAPST